VKGTRYIRVKLEWILEYPTEINLPSPPNISAMCNDASLYLRPPDGTDVLPGAKLGMSLHFPRGGGPRIEPLVEEARKAHAASAKKAKKARR
jgi:hypothetical protein